MDMDMSICTGYIENSIVFNVCIKTYNILPFQIPNLKGYEMKKDLLKHRSKFR